YGVLSARCALPILRRRRRADLTAPLTADGPLAELGAEILLELQDLGRQGPAAQLFETGIAGVALGVPLVGEAAGRDVVHQLAHRCGHVEMVVAADAGELPVLARRRVVQRLGGAALEPDEPVGPFDLSGKDEL